MTIELLEASVAKEGAAWAGFEKYMGWVDGHVKFAETHPSHTVNAMDPHPHPHPHPFPHPSPNPIPNPNPNQVDVMDLAWMDRSWQAYWAYLAPFEPTHSAGHPLVLGLGLGLGIGLGLGLGVG